MSKRNKLKDELEQEARIALLQHFSSKSSDQVKNCLTIALGFFSFITAIVPIRTLFGEGSIPFLNGVSSKMLCDIFTAFILSSFVALSVHTLSRLFYWGDLATSVLSCEMASPQRMMKFEAENAKKNKMD